MPLNDSVPIAIKLQLKEYVVERGDLEQHFPGRYLIRQTIPLRTARFAQVLTVEDLALLDQLAEKYKLRNGA